MSDSAPEWAGNPVPWNPELSDVVPSATPVPGADTWTVPFEDFTTPDNAFTAPDNPFALEMRAETIEQLVGGDSLRRGESECVEAGRSGTNADLVGGRDRVQAQGRLHEHTGRDFAAQAAHLEATVDGSLDVHAVRDDTVLHAGHMVEEWEGGTAVLAGIADDLVAGGGVRVTAPLDLWVHGLMGVEERIGTCTADAVLAEFAATHYEREYGSGVHRAAVAVLQGKLYQTTRSQFYPLMKVSTGVRNLVAGGGDGGGGSTPATSPPATPPPGEGGAPVEAASETLSIATDSARSMEGGVEGAVRMEDAANLRRIADAADAGTETDPRTYPPPVVTLERVDSESIRSTGSASSEGLVRPGWMDELFADADVLLADIGRSLEDPGATPGAEELSGLGHPAGSAEQLAALRRGEFATDVPVPGLDRSPSASPDVRTWEEMLDGLLHELTDHRLLALADTTDPADARVHQAAANTHQAAVDEIARKILWEFSRFGGEADDLHPAHTEAGKARTAYRILENKLIEAERANNVDLAAGIQRALREIDQFTSRRIDDLRVLSEIPGTGADSRPPTPGSVSDTHSAGEAAGAGTRVPEGDPPPSQGPHTPGWGKMYNSLYLLLDDARQAGNQAAADAYQSAVYNIADKVWTEFVRLGGDTEDLTPGHVSPTTRAEEAYRILERTALRAEHFNDWGRAAEIRRALDKFDAYTHRYLVDLSARADEFAGAVSGAGPRGEFPAHVDPDKLGAWIQERIDESMHAVTRAELADDAEGSRLAMAELEYWQAISFDVAGGRDPGHTTSVQIADLNRAGDHATADELEALQGRLLEAMDDPSMYRTRASTGDIESIGTDGWLASDTASLPLSPEAALPFDYDASSLPQRLHDGWASTGNVVFDSDLHRLGKPPGARPTDLHKALALSDTGAFPGHHVGSDTAGPVGDVARSLGSGGPSPDGVSPRASGDFPSSRQPPAADASIPGDDRWLRGSPGMRSPEQQPGFGEAQAAGAQWSGSRSSGLQAGDTPQFGGPAAEQATGTAKWREDVVRRLEQGEVMPDALFRTLAFRLGEAQSGLELVPGRWEWQALPQLIGDLHTIAEHARAAGSSTADYSRIDWAALYALLALFEARGRL